jgi:SAM-dependent methyltransferase
MRPQQGHTVDHFIKPLASITDRRAFETFRASSLASGLFDYENGFVAAYDGRPLTIPGFCWVCRQDVGLLVDMNWGERADGGREIPNWRERLVCPFCRLNNRQRLMVSIVAEEVENTRQTSLYVMEAITPTFDAIKTKLNYAHIVGSEYLGAHEIGKIVNGIRHEDVENLSFASEEIDAIVSNDVFEHLPNPVRGFSECFRVLRPGGQLFATFPFQFGREKSVARARIAEGLTEFLLPPIYHGNPLSEAGSLVFTDFGWDLVDQVKQVGFSSIRLEFYRSIHLGHLGEYQLVFRLRK